MIRLWFGYDLVDHFIMVYVYPLCIYISYFHVISWFNACTSLLIIYLLVDELSSQKLTKKQFHFFFLFWDCTSLFLCSLGTFLGHTSLALFPGMEVKYIFPRISLLIWFWEVNKIRKYLRQHFHQVVVQNGYQKDWNKRKTYFTITFGCFRSKTYFERSYINPNISVFSYFVYSWSVRVGIFFCIFRRGKIICLS